MSDGVIKSIITLVTKKGEQFEIQSWLTREEFRDKAAEVFVKKETFIFPINTPEGGEDIIFPHDSIYSLRVRDFSAIRKVNLIPNSK